MTIPQRTVSISGVFAEDATTTIPTPPVSGTAYRDTGLTAAEAKAGWPYKRIVDSSKFNQALYEYSSITQMVEKYGFLPWSQNTDYEQGSLALGTNGVVYQAKQATGPSSTAYNPVNDSTATYWENYLSGIMSLIYPVGSIYTGTQSTCPMEELISGSTWTLRASKIVTNVSSTVAVKGTGKTLGLTNGQTNCGLSTTNNQDANTRIFKRSAFNKNVAYPGVGGSEDAQGDWGVVTDSTKSGLTGTATSTTFTVNIWERTA